MPPPTKSNKKRSSRSRKKDVLEEIPPLQPISLEDKQSQSAGTLSSSITSSGLASQENCSSQSGPLPASVVTEVESTSLKVSNPGIDVEDISPRATDGILPQLIPTTIPKITNEWWISKPSQRDTQVPLPKNFIELAAYKQMNIDLTSRTEDRYKNLGKKKLEETIFEPLVQPTDFTRVDSENNFLCKNILLPDLIDPEGFRKLVPDSYPRETFAHIAKIAKVLEGRKSLTHPTTRLESSFLWSVIVRMTETFLTFANLIQIPFNKNAMATIYRDGNKEEFQRTIVCALNSFAQELYSLEPIISCKVSDRETNKFQREVLNLFNYRLGQAPTLAPDPLLNIVCPQGMQEFRTQNLTFNQISNNPNSRKRRRNNNKRGRKSKKQFRGKQGRRPYKRKGHFPRHNMKVDVNNNIKENSIRNLNLRSSPKIAQASSKVEIKKT